MPHRILLIDSQTMFRQGVQALLSREAGHCVVGEADNGEQACTLALKLHPDIVLTDMLLPGDNASETIAKIRRLLPTVKIVVLTDTVLERHVRKALHAGIDGYVLKKSSFDELLRALNAAMQGRRHLSAEVSGPLLDEYLRLGRSGAKLAPLHALTRRELSTLQLIAEGHSNKRAAESLGINIKTIEKYRASLMRKLGLNNFGELMVAAVEMGLVERPGPVARLVPDPASKQAAVRQGAAWS